MKRRTLLSMSAMLLMLALVTVAAPRAQAQCCSYQILVPCNIFQHCLPWTFTTNFGGTVQNNVVTGCGPWTFPIVGCPPVRTFSWISPDGGITRIALNETKEVTINGCPFVCIKPIANPVTGCIEIHIWQCPAT